MPNSVTHKIYARVGMMYMLDNPVYMLGISVYILGIYVGVTGRLGGTLIVHFHFFKLKKFTY